MKNIAIIIILLVNIKATSQSKYKGNIFVDENYEILSVNEFNKKKNCYLFYETIKQTDSATIHILRQRKKYGKLNENELIILKESLLKDYNVTLKPNETLVINFKDTLFGLSQLKKYRKPHVMHLPYGDTINYYQSSRVYDKNRKTFDSYQKKCHKKYAKLNSKSLYLYSLNLGNTYDYKNVTWNKVNDVLQSLFFKGSFFFLVLKANGEYLMYTEDADYVIEKIIAMEDWTPLFEEYNQSLIDLPETYQSKVIKYRHSRGRAAIGNGIDINSSKEEYREWRERLSYTYSSGKSCFCPDY